MYCFPSSACALLGQLHPRPYLSSRLILRVQNVKMFLQPISYLAPQVSHIRGPPIWTLICRRGATAMRRPRVLEPICPQPSLLVVVSTMATAAPVPTQIPFCCRCALLRKPAGQPQLAPWCGRCQSCHFIFLIYLISWRRFWRLCDYEMAKIANM